MEQRAHEQIIHDLTNERDGYSSAMMEEERRADRLQAQLEGKDTIILQMGGQAAVLAKENIDLKAQLEAVREERDRRATGGIQ